MKFESVRSYNSFVEDVLRYRRYVLSTPSRRFLEAVQQTARHRILKVDAGSTLARAQVGCRFRQVPIQGTNDTVDEPFAYEEQRMKPLSDRAADGRANPKGIPVLYLADAVNTAVGEVRPEIGSYVSVGVFKVTRDLEMVDCGDKPRSIIYMKEPGFKKREEAVWWDINRAFARPVRRSDDQAEYAPTQIIAELLKSEGYDGIIYRSAFGNGKNYVVFDIDAVDFDYCNVVEVKGVETVFDVVPNAGYRGR